MSHTKRPKYLGTAGGSMMGVTGAVVAGAVVVGTMGFDDDDDDDGISMYGAG
jgi:hypothetical protein